MRPAALNVILRRITTSLHHFYYAVRDLHYFDSKREASRIGYATSHNGI